MKRVAVNISVKRLVLIIQVHARHRNLHVLSCSGTEALRLRHLELLLASVVRISQGGADRKLILAAVRDGPPPSCFLLNVYLILFQPPIGVYVI